MATAAADEEEEEGVMGTWWCRCDTTLVAGSGTTA